MAPTPMQVVGILLLAAFITGTVVGQTLPASVELSKWSQPLLKPPVIRPHCGCDGTDKYEVTISKIQHRFHPDLGLTTCYGYNGIYPGPTFEAIVNRPVEVVWRNWLPEKHILPTEPLSHGGEPPPPDSASVTHLHGAHVPAESDGDPMDWVPRGEEHHYRYPNDQLALTMWYHDHVMTRTRVNVYAGLAGFYLLRDRHEKSLGLPRGRYEVPMIIQDRRILNDSQLYYPFLWGAFEGDTPVVNGRVYPYHEVKPRAYRFRWLNGCNHRFLTLSLPDGPKIWQIGSDGGFLEEPVHVTSITLGPSERVDVIIDFHGFEGKEFILTNSAPAPFPSTDPTEERMREILKFKVSDEGPKCKPYKIPSLKCIADVPPLPSLGNLPMHSIAMERNLELSQGLVVDENNKTTFMFLLNGKRFHDPPTETPLVDTVELWHIINRTPLTHPIHIHLTQFRVLQRRPFNTTLYVSGQPIPYTGPARLPPEEERGWKDTAKTNPGEVTSFWVPFTKYTGQYVWHCHMLEHEDHDMMRPLVVLPRDGSGEEPPPGGHGGMEMR